jgi:general secretion pathway protein D
MRTLFSSERPALHSFKQATLFIAVSVLISSATGGLNAYAQQAGMAPPPGQMGNLPPVNPLAGSALPQAFPPAIPQPQAMQSSGLSGSKVSEPIGNFKRGEPVTLNFVNAEIDAVARAIGVMTGRNMVIDPRVKGTINMNTEQPIPPQAAYNMFLTTIRLQGFTVVEASGLSKVVPEAEAKLQSSAVSVGAVSGSGSTMQTQIFALNFESANNLVPILRPLISPNNTINVNPGNNSLVITDYAENLQRMARIIAALDVSNATDVEIIPLRHAIASDLAPLVLKLIESSGAGAAAGAAGQADTAFRTTLVAEPRSNSLILRAANGARVALVKSLVAKLDQPNNTANGSAGNIYVVHLKNADATKLAVTLRAALSSSGTPAVSPGLAPSTPTTPGVTQSSGTSFTSAAGAQPSTGGQIQADPATNTLIITASEPQYRQLRAVIDKLDARRAQVFVESLIAEISTEKAADFGIQWQGALGKAGGSNIGILGTNFSPAVVGANIISLATGAAKGTSLPSTGGNFGVAHNTNGVYVLGFLARFLESSGDGNVLSTPNILTLDNEEAKISVGENRPFLTGQFTNTGTTGSTVNPFQTIERKDVGLTLRIKPQISENGTIKLQVFQEVSSVQAATVGNAQGPTTNKRVIESTVLVDDGAVVVLGGLLSDEFSGNQEKVPGVGDIPFFGNLFKGESRARKKTNLMVFLRPVVVRDAASADALSMNRYDQIRGNQIDVQPKQSKAVPINEGPVLPVLISPSQPAVQAIDTPQK